nr:protein scabrous [Bactrocera oleae]
MLLLSRASIFWRSGAFVSLIGTILVACLMQLPVSAVSVMHSTQQQQKGQQQQQQRLGNMLRDAAFNKNAPNDQVLSDNDVATVDELDSDNYIGDDFANDFAAASERYAASAESSSVELLRFVDERDDATLVHATTTGAASAISTTTPSISTTTITVAPPHEQNADALPLAEQVQLLSKQLNALMMRRREDYELLEHNLRKSLRIGTTAGDVLSAGAEDADMRTELQDLRREVAALRDGHLGGNKERLTVEWLQQSIAEIRKQLVELQGLASEASKSISHRSQGYEDMATVRNDFTQLKLEVAALRERQQQSEVFVQELREEALQQEEDYKRLLLRAAPSPTVVKGMPAEPALVLEEKQMQQQLQQTVQSSEIDSENNELIHDPLTADHKRRHCRFQRQQIHELQLAQRSLKSQLNELKYHRIGERVRNLEIEQHRMADANFNLSRQIASLDKLHTSMLELLEDVESLQTKMDKSLPELRHEISKLEFTSAQLTVEESLLREEGKNVARSVQAMAVSVSTLQDERDANKQMQVAVAQLRGKLDRLESVSQDMQRAVMQQQKQRSAEHKLHHSHQKHHNHQHRDTSSKNNNDDKNIPPGTAEAHDAESLVAKLENVEEQYESIIQNLPQDCSGAPTGSAAGLFMISPAGQQQPRLVHCTADGWTTIQRRYDGSADFNRSWADYATGFGQPAGEYWIGNEQLHHLTRNNCTQLLILMQDIYDNVWLAQYDRFYISSRADGYRLNTAGYSGNASDALDYQQGMQFSAIDVDRDISQTHCAANYEGGWWFSHCQHANLNGRYNLGLTWFDATRNEWIAVKSSEMLIKRQTASKCSAEPTAAEVTTTSWQIAPAAASTSLSSSSSSSSPSLPAAPPAGQQLLTDEAHSEAMLAAAAPAAVSSATLRPVRSPATKALYASAARL